jgi:hypothetical protein
MTDQEIRIWLSNIGLSIGAVSEDDKNPPHFIRLAVWAAQLDLLANEARKNMQWRELNLEAGGVCHRPDAPGPATLSPPDPGVVTAKGVA